MVLIIYQAKIIVSLQGRAACSPWSRADEKKKGYHFLMSKPLFVWFLFF